MPKYRVLRHEIVQPLDQSYRFIPLTQGQNAIVDANDFEWLSTFAWYADFDKTGFYAKYGHRNAVRMHRLILGCKKGEFADHINGDTLDNRRENLRKCSQLENAKNRKKHRKTKSAFKGICQDMKTGRWRVRIAIAPKKRVNVGYFVTQEEAARAYDVAAKIHYGEFASLNFP